jgi:S-adenosylmethionine:tRNA ribosyltransferase-isomerase
MTNFHLPRSTLLAMIAALPNMGIARLLDYYRTAIEAEYRFYSYGDAMWLAP